MGKPQLTIGTLGQINHGKSTLTAAITKVLAESGAAKFSDYEKTSFPPEEKKGAVTISAAHVEYETSSRHYAHIDCASHTDVVKNVVTGATPMDIALLVISATDGLMPQTKDHIHLATQAGISQFVVFVNRCDIIRDEMLLDTLELEAREYLCRGEVEGDEVAFIRGSALEALEGGESGIGRDAILKLMEELDNCEPESRPPRKTTGTRFAAEVYFLLTEEGGLDKPFTDTYSAQFSIEGTQVSGVVTGEGELGTVKPGDRITCHIKTDKTVTVVHLGRFTVLDGGRVVGVGFF